MRGSNFPPGASKNRHLLIFLFFPFSFSLIITHVWEELEDYRVKDFGPILADRWQIVADNLIGIEQNYSVKVRSIQNNLHLICKIM